MSASAACELLAARCAAVPALLQSLMLPEGPSDAAAAARPDLRFAATSAPGLRFVTTGIGTSEGPARLLAHLLREHAGAAARFVPLSALAGAGLALVGEGADAALVVFSQGLSPNAQLALAQAGRFAALLVYTSMPASEPQLRALAARGAAVTVLPPVGPPGEDRLFLRVLGPAAAQLAAAQLADAVAARRGGPRLPLRAAVQATLAAPARARQALAALGAGLVARGLLSEAALAAHGLGALWRAQPEPTLAFITSGGYGELGLGLRWKFLEGAGLSEPLAWDVLQVAHGPFQQTFRRPLFLCALTRGQTPVEQALLGRLQAMLPPHHVLLQLPAEPPGPLALLSHDLACNELLLAVLRGRDWDLLDWPGRCCDGPLYELADGAELLAATARPD